MEDLELSESEAANLCSCCETLNRRRLSFSLRNLIFIGVTCIAGLAALTALFTYLLTQNLPGLLNVRSDVSETSLPPMSMEKMEDKTSSTSDEKKLIARIPTDLWPIFYDLKFIPIFDEKKRNFSVCGEVDILVNITHATERVVLHARSLFFYLQYTTIREANSSNATNVPILFQFYENDNDFFVVTLGSSLQLGKQYNIKLKWSSRLQEASQGIFRNYYWEYGDIQYLAATQFQPTKARWGYPCFDEPHMKARFRIHVGRPKHMISASNMPLESSEVSTEVQDYMLDHYPVTKLMPTYLVAFVVTPMKFVQSGNIRIFARKLAMNQTAYALDLVPKFIKFFEEFLGVPFPYPKLDIFAMPELISAGMENIGLITFRENIILLDSHKSTRSNQESIAGILAHEIVHQWFGNLVSINWWNDLWLNEGLATYMQEIAINAIEPTWNTIDQFVNLKQYLVTSSETNMGVTAVIPDIKYDENILDAFNLLSYVKGAAIMRMMNNTLSEDVFKRGINRYLTTYANQIIDQDKLAESLEIEAKNASIISNDTSLVKIMKSYTLQPGIPVVIVKRDYENGTVHITQKRFSHANYTFPKETLWQIPISYTTAMEMNFWDTKAKFWLNESSYELQNLNITNNHWLMFNLYETGYYRVLYDMHNYDLISQHLHNDHESIPSINRAQVMNDAFAFARTGYLRYSEVLNLTTYLTNEKHFGPWNVFIGEMDFLTLLLSDTEGYDYFRNYIRKVIDNIYNYVGYEEHSEDSDVKKKLRVKILQWACEFGHEDCVKRARALFQDWQSSRNPDAYNPIPANIRRSTFCVGMRYGDEKEWLFLWDRYLASDLASEQTDILFAMGCARERWLNTRYLYQTSTAGKLIRRHELIYVFQGLGLNPVAKDVLFQFYIKNWQWLYNYLQDPALIKVLTLYATSGLQGEHNLRQLQEFYDAEKLNLGDGRDSIEESLDAALMMAKEKDHLVKDITSWFLDMDQR